MPNTGDDNPHQTGKRKRPRSKDLMSGEGSSPEEIRGSKVQAFLNQIDTEKYPPLSATYQVNPAYQGLFTPKPTPLQKDEPMTPEEYEAGYISQTGLELINEIEAHAEPTPEQKKRFAKLETKVGTSKSSGFTESRSGKQMFEGEQKRTKYHNVQVDYRVDYTREGEAYKPHPRIMVGKQDLSTKALAKYSAAMSDSEHEAQFVEGMRGGKVSSEAGALGVQMRAVIRGSDVFNKPQPLLEGHQMSKLSTAQEVSHLFEDPVYGTGQIGSQTSGAMATREYLTFHAIVDKPGKPLSQSTRLGTDLESTPQKRKVNALNASFPKEKPLIKVDVRRKK